MKVKIVLPVWGDRYIDDFIKYIVPTHLDSSNIPHLSQSHKIKYTIYTTKKDLARLLIEESLIILQNYASLEVKILSSRRIKDVYGTYSFVHNKELKISAKDNEAVYLLNADILLSNNFFTTTLSIIKKGYKSVNIIIPRTNIEIFEKYHSLNQFETKKFKPDYLIKLWLKNPHKLMRYHFMNDKGNTKLLPSSLYWMNSKQGAYIRSFHLHPVVVLPKKLKIAKFKETIDSGIIYEMMSRKFVYVEEKYDLFFALELSHKNKFYKPVGSQFDSSSYLNYYAASNKLNFAHLQHEIVIGKITSYQQNLFTHRANKLISFLLMEYLSRKGEQKNSPVSVFSLFIIYKMAAILKTNQRFIPNKLYKYLRKRFVYARKTLSVFYNSPSNKHEKNILS
jgi:hypothetical protein